MKIVVAQFYTKNLIHGPYAEAINKKYCEEQGYTYYVDKDNDKIWERLEGRAPTWYKPKLILDVFEKENPDYVLFLDTDAIISDFNGRIEQFIGDSYSFIAAEDVSEHSEMNAGVFLIKNNEWAKTFIQAWWDLGGTLTGASTTRITMSEADLLQIGYFKDRLWIDQSILTIMYDSYPEYREQMKVISNRSFNWDRYDSENFIFHAYAYGQIPGRTLDLIHNKVFNIEINLDHSSLASLGDFYHTDKHYGHDYFKKVYQNLFEPIRLSVTKFMELGVHEGASIEVWKRFFPNATIYGLDLTPDFAKIPDKTRIELAQVNTSIEIEVVEKARDYSDVDIFMDDGSHMMKDQQITLAAFFKCVKPGGLYILEDLHTSESVRDPNNPGSIWGDKGQTTTLGMLEEYIETGKIKSEFISEEDSRYLEENISSLDIFRLNGNWSITSVIVKK